MTRSLATRPALALLACAALFALSACGDDPAFGGGEEETPPDPLALDLSGTDQPANLGTAESAAKAAVGVTRIVDATAQLASELGDAVGDLFPTEDNPCPQGGSASSDVSGSPGSPRLRMEFHACVRGPNTLDGIATVTCHDLSGSECRRGDVVIGENGAVLWFRSDDPESPRIILMRGTAAVESDQAAGRLHVLASLQGELRALADARRYSFVAENLDVVIQEQPENRAEVRINGLAAFGGGAAGAQCVSGRLDAETLEALQLTVEGIVAGRMRLHSPPPRPGTQQAEVAFTATGADSTGADGGTANFTTTALEAFCSVR